MANVEVPGVQQDWARLTKMQIAVEIWRSNPTLSRKEVIEQAALRGHSLSLTTVDSARARVRGRPHTYDVTGRKQLGLSPDGQARSTQPGPITSIRDLIATVRDLKVNIEKLGGLEQVQELFKLF